MSENKEFWEGDLNTIVKKLWKDFRYSYTKNPNCMLTNRQLFDMFKAHINGTIIVIEAMESF